MAQRVVEAVLAEARAEIAAGRFPDVIALRARLAGDADALARLDGVLAVHRARARMAQAAVPGTRPRPLRTRPTVTSDMDVRKAGEFVLAWDALPAVAVWEVRISERADVRSDYDLVARYETSETRAELSLGDRPLRVHVVGRSPTGRVVRRALVSGLTRESWNDRWQKR
jgi:hypothetical protein